MSLTNSELSLSLTRIKKNVGDIPYVPTNFKLLLETGDGLLLESNDSLLLENDSGELNGG